MSVRNISSRLIPPSIRSNVIVLRLFSVSAIGSLQLTFLSTEAQAQATISVYVNAPRTTASVYTGTSAETFSSLTADTRRTTDYAAQFGTAAVVGTYTATTTNPFQVLADGTTGNGQYSSGTGNYIAIGAQAASANPLTLTFANAQTYFGISINALDPNNGLTFYNGNTLIGRFSSATIQSLLSAPTIRATNGSTYNGTDYNGKPTNTSINNGEKYAYLNFLAGAGQSFTRIVFDNSSNTGTGFETDNHTIRTGTTAQQLASPLTPDGSFVFVTNVSVPEPSSIALMGMAASTFAATSFRRRKREA